jgi:hypothetical protein
MIHAFCCWAAVQRFSVSGCEAGPPMCYFCVLYLVLGADAADTLVPLALPFKSFYVVVRKACVNSDTALCYRPFVAPLFAAPGEFQCSVPRFLDVPKTVPHRIVHFPL